MERMSAMQDELNKLRSASAVSSSSASFSILSNAGGSQMVPGAASGDTRCGLTAPSVEDRRQAAALREERRRRDAADRLEEIALRREQLEEREREEKREMEQVQARIEAEFQEFLQNAEREQAERRSRYQMLQLEAQQHAQKQMRERALEEQRLERDRAELLKVAEAQTPDGTQGGGTRLQRVMSTVAMHSYASPSKPQAQTVANSFQSSQAAPLTTASTARILATPTQLGTALSSALGLSGFQSTYAPQWPPKTTAGSTSQGQPRVPPEVTSDPNGDQNRADEMLNRWGPGGTTQAPSAWSARPRQPTGNEACQDGVAEILATQNGSWTAPYPPPDNWSMQPMGRQTTPGPVAQT